MNDELLFEWFRQNEADILRYLPYFLSRDNELKTVADACSKEHEKIRLLIRDWFYQFFVDTATWGLKYWEEFLNITPQNGDNYTTRRNRIKILLNAHDVSTKNFMTNLINRFLNDNSGELIEHNESYYFDICFNNGSLFDWEGLKEAIKLYKPAHLGVKFFAMQNVQSSVFVYGLINIAQQIEVEAEKGYSIEPIDNIFTAFGLVNIASQMELNFDTSIGEKNLSLDGKTIFYGIADDANTIEI